MEVEGGAKKTLNPTKTREPRSKGKLLTVVRERRKKKLNAKKKLRTVIQKKKQFSEMTDESSGKDWKLVLKEKFDTICQNTGPNLAFGLSRLFHEENRSLMARVVEILGDEDSKEAARRALEAFCTGGMKRTDGVGERSAGGIFFRIIKENLEREDPAKLKAIFIKSEGAKKRKHQIRKLKKKQDKQNPQLGVRLMNPNSSKPIKNPYENIFNALV